MAFIGEYHMDIAGEEETISVDRGFYADGKPDGTNSIVLQTWTEFRPFVTLTVNLSEYSIYPERDCVFIPRTTGPMAELVQRMIDDHVLSRTDRAVKYNGKVADEFKLEK